jgi:homocitrate synthase NifV
MKLNPLVKPVKIIDRTLPEIFRGSNMSRLDILDFCWTLRNIGADILEIDCRLLEKIGKLPEGLEFILRLDKPEDLKFIGEYKITACIFDSGIPISDSGIYEQIRRNGLKTVMEIRAEDIGELENHLEGEPSGKEAACIRILGLERETCNDWVGVAAGLKEKLGLELDVCACNRYSAATAIALEAVEAGMDYVTASFAGYGNKFGFTPIEELVSSMKLFGLGKKKADLTCLPSLKMLFERAVHKKIPPSKPVIGEAIFRYESGIHAGAIEREPVTYEPYDPSIVGLKRDLVIGKHSGSTSLRKKLTELGVRAEGVDMESMLAAVRDTSIKLDRCLNNNELITLYHKLQ